MKHLDSCVTCEDLMGNWRPSEPYPYLRVLLHNPFGGSAVGRMLEEIPSLEASPMESDDLSPFQAFRLLLPLHENLIRQPDRSPRSSDAGFGQRFPQVIAPATEGNSGTELAGAASSIFRS